MEINTILKIVVIVVVLSIVILVFSLFMPQASKNVELVTAYTMEFTTEELPCLLNCYSTITGDVDRLLRETRFLERSKSDKLIEYFHCNNEILKVITMLIELARWKETNVLMGIEPEPYTLESGESYTSKAREFLYKCVAFGDCNDDYDKTLSNFCMVDEYLNYYGYLDCISDFTLNDFINPRRFRYEPREGKDISNDFVCELEALGEDYLGPYNLCVFDSETKYGPNCKPSWKTLGDQEYSADSEYSLGRCEDFALLYKTLFRGIGVSENNLVLTLGYCDLPPPCKELVNRRGINYNSTACIVPANLTVKGVGVVKGCNESLMNNYPDEFYGEYLLKEVKGNYEYVFTVKQPIDKAGYFRNLTFNGVVSDDVRWYVGYSEGELVEMEETNLLSSPEVEVEIEKSEKDYIFSAYPQNKLKIDGAEVVFFCDPSVSERCTPSNIEFFEEKGRKLDFEGETGKISFGLKVRVKRLKGGSCGDSAVFRLGLKGGGLNAGEDFQLFQKQTIYLRIDEDFEDLSGVVSPYLEVRDLPDGCTIIYEISEQGLIVDTFSESYASDLNEYELARLCDNFITEGTRINLITSTKVDSTMKALVSEEKLRCDEYCVSMIEAGSDLLSCSAIESLEDWESFSFYNCAQETRDCTVTLSNGRKCVCDGLGCKPICELVSCDDYCSNNMLFSDGTCNGLTGECDYTLINCEEAKCETGISYHDGYCDAESAVCVYEETDCSKNYCIGDNRYYNGECIEGLCSYEVEDCAFRGDVCAYGLCVAPGSLEATCKNNCEQMNLESNDLTSCDLIESLDAYSGGLGFANLNCMTNFEACEVTIQNNEKCVCDDSCCHAPGESCS